MNRSGLLAAAVAFDVASALFHARFGRIFRWDRALARLDDVNGGIVRVMNLALVYLSAGVFVLGALLHGAAIAR
jgi:hypothetical protein